MNDRDLFSEEQRDYLVELLNIGGGNASTALSHLLQSEVAMKMPRVEIMPVARAVAALGGPSMPFCVGMKMVGDLTGCLFFLVADDQKAKLADLGERAMLGPARENPDPERVLATVAEVGNILAGVYLTAIHDFCKLNVCHSVPLAGVDMMQSLLDESLARGGEDQPIILVSNEFVIGADRLETFFLIFPARASLAALVGSMGEAAKMYGDKHD
jgi:chemotaxis protein CheC